MVSSSECCSSSARYHRYCKQETIARKRQKVFDASRADDGSQLWQAAFHVITYEDQNSAFTTPMGPIYEQLGPYFGGEISIDDESSVTNIVSCWVRSQRRIRWVK